MKENSKTVLWNDSADPRELADALTWGIVGATCNPVIALTALKADAPHWVECIKEYSKSHPTATEDEIGWAMVKELSINAAKLLEAFGIHQQFHSHADSHNGTYQEVERYLQETDPLYSNLCLDTGHFAYYLGDNLKMMNAYPERIGYLHLKQVHPDILAETLKNDVPFGDAVAKGVMTEPGFEGVPKFAPIIERALEINPDIFAIIEQDMYGCPVDMPFPIAQRTREHILAATRAARVK